MLRFDEGEEVFFDTAESFSSEESLVVKEELDSGIGYDTWMELKSVKERREKFLISMGFVEASSVDCVAINESETMGMDRIVECSGAVTSSCASSVEENLACDRRESNGEANCTVESEHEWQENLSVALEKEMAEHPCSSVDHGSRKLQAKVEEFVKVNEVNKKKKRNWWQKFLQRKKNKVFDVSNVQKVSDKAGELTRVRVQQNKKRYMEFTAVYPGQEISAHKGLIWTMKFSPDGQYLASGGEDGVIRIWSVSSVDSSCTTSPCSSQSHRIEDSGFKRKKSRDAYVVIPEQVFHINESSVHELHGHTGDILDLAWSTSNHLLSTSTDNTVRFWQVGCNECLSVFLHSNCVTCVQFNPVDENYFITGSVDGKVRIWGVPEKRVINWADGRNIITSVCYQPNGKGFVTGSASGTCRFFELSGTDVLLNAEIQISGKRKLSGNKITGIQFLENDSQRVIMITSEDSRIRILDGLEIVHKYKGLTKSGCQMSASFTATGQHIISVGEDSRVYIWNYDQPHIQSPKAKRSARSCEHFFFEGISVAIPWSGRGTESKNAWLETQEHQGWYSWARDPESFSLGSWFAGDILSKGSVTWPEEKLPLCEVPSTELDNHLEELQHQNNSPNCRNYSATWDLVIVTAGWDGMIRTFHNYGLPTKI